MGGKLWARAVVKVHVVAVWKDVAVNVVGALVLHYAITSSYWHLIHMVLPFPLCRTAF